MKKIGIITFHRAMNFGAMLQAFALQTVLEEKCESLIIDYRSDSIEQFYFKKGVQYKCIMIIRFFLLHSLYNFITIKEKNFAKFEKKYLKTTRRKYNKKSIVEANKYFDAFISGSDQVWNPGCIKDDMNYLLAFADKEKRFSYAASFGNSKLVFDTGRRDRYKELIGSIQIPLLREEAGKNILKGLGTENYLEAKVVCDPVFLLSRCQWVNALHLKENKSEKYILLFIVTPAKNAEQFALNLKIKTGYEVRYISTYGDFGSCPDWCVDYMTVGPREFLELLMNAKYVVTTSFHGLAFSINFGKSFFYEKDYRKDNNNDRIEYLARYFDVENREIKTSELPMCLDIERTKMGEQVAQYAAQSKKILFQTLNLA